MGQANGEEAKRITNKQIGKKVSILDFLLVEIFFTILKSLK